MRVKTLLLVLVLGLAGAACGGSDDTADPPPEDTATDEPTDEPTAEVTDEDQQRIAEAAQNTLDQGTARFALTVEAPDLAGTAGETTTVEGEGEEHFGDDQRRLTTRGAQGEQEIVVDGSQAYLLLPARGAEQWGRLDLADQPAGTAGPVAAGGALALRSSRTILELLRDASTDAGEAGEDEVEGEAATRYEVTVDLAAAGEAQDPAGGRGAAADPAQTEELAMVVWVDADERIRRVSYTTDVAPPDAGNAPADAPPEPYSVTVTLTYLEFGVDAGITLPEEDTIFDLS